MNRFPDREPCQRSRCLARYHTVTRPAVWPFGGVQGNDVPLDREELQGSLDRATLETEKAKLGPLFDQRGGHGPLGRLRVNRYTKEEQPDEGFDRRPTRGPPNEQGAHLRVCHQSWVGAENLPCRVVRIPHLPQKVPDSAEAILGHGWELRGEIVQFAAAFRPPLHRLPYPPLLVGAADGTADQSDGLLQVTHQQS